MQEPATTPWGLGISEVDLKKLKASFEPKDMDDKWRVSVMNHSQSGKISVRVARSWTGKELYVLVIKPGVSGSGEIEAITWEQNKGGIRISEEQAKKEVVITTRRLLGCEFDALPGYSFDDVFNYYAVAQPGGE